MSLRWRAPLFVAALLGMCGALLYAPSAPLMLRAPAALLLCLLPGWLLAVALLGRAGSAYDRL